MSVDVAFNLRLYSFGRMRPCGICNDCCSRSPKTCEAWSDPEYIVGLQVPEWYAPARR